ncbi:hypothetical protein D7319_05290 [Streptomyces radicis]|uniref:Uncharacterized protein n=1 Tax=Streptomyces radicis TaxID=1750517 RepID=A0A3A9WEA1_9ACTN|nr:hypothetical protein D7319_05290 [Streptomyces radicis]
MVHSSAESYPHHATPLTPPAARGGRGPGAQGGPAGGGDHGRGGGGRGGRGRAEVPPRAVAPLNWPYSTDAGPTGCCRRREGWVRSAGRAYHSASWARPSGVIA